MDNLTHSLLGLALAKAASRTKVSQRAESRLGSKWHTLIILVSTFANNIPDIDLVYSMSSKLNYLVHHRGYTHTLVSLVPLSIILLFLIRLWSRKKNISILRTEWTFLAALTLGGGIAHLILDSTNSYGLHPFWPFQNSWYYGDSIFIVEPWLWIGLTAFIYHDLRSRMGRALAIGIYFLAIGISIKTQVVPLPIILALFIVGLIVHLTGSFSRGQWRCLPGAALLIAIYTAFFWTKQVALDIFHQNVQMSFSNYQLLDVSMSPSPANPYCWTAVAAMTKDHQYIVVKAKVGPVLGKPNQLDCSLLPIDSGLAKLIPVETSSTSKLKWIGYSEMKLEDIGHLGETCEFQSMMKFARIPFWNEEWLGDLRYDHSKNGGFCSIRRFPPTELGCSINLPNWTPPRLDLLNKFSDTKSLK